MAKRCLELGSASSPSRSNWHARPHNHPGAQPYLFFYNLNKVDCKVFWNNKGCKNGLKQVNFINFFLPNKLFNCKVFQQIYDCWKIKKAEAADWTQAEFAQIQVQFLGVVESVIFKSTIQFMIFGVFYCICCESSA